MNNITDKSKTKTLVEELRIIRDKLNLETQDLSIEQLKIFWKNKETLHPTRIWKK